MMHGSSSSNSSSTSMKKMGLYFAVASSALAAAAAAGAGIMHQIDNNNTAVDDSVNILREEIEHLNENLTELHIQLVATKTQLQASADREGELQRNIDELLLENNRLKSEIESCEDALEKSKDDLAKIQQEKESMHTAELLSQLLSKVHLTKKPTAK